MPGALRWRQLCQSFKAAYVRLHAAVQLWPLLADLVCGKDFTKPNEMFGRAKPSTYAYAGCVSKSVRCAVAVQARCCAQGARLFVRKTL